MINHLLAIIIAITTDGPLVEYPLFTEQMNAMIGLLVALVVLVSLLLVLIIAIVIILIVIILLDRWARKDICKEIALEGGSVISIRRVFWIRPGEWEVIYRERDGTICTARCTHTRTGVFWNKGR